MKQTGEAKQFMILDFNRRFGEGCLIRLTTNYLGERRIYDARPKYDVWRNAENIFVACHATRKIEKLNLYARCDNNLTRKHPRWSVPLKDIDAFPPLWQHLARQNLFHDIRPEKGTNSVYLSRFIVAICGLEIAWGWNMSQTVRLEADHINEDTADDRLSNIRVLSTTNHIRRHGFFRAPSIITVSPEDERGVVESLRTQDVIYGEFEDLQNKQVKKWTLDRF